MKRRVRGACAALAACLLLACALGAAAAGLRCVALGAGLRGEPFRLGAAAGAFYSGPLLAAGLALLGAARLCRRGPRGAGRAAGRAAGGAGGAGGAARRRNLLLLGVLVFVLGVLSAFAGAVIDGDAVSLAGRKYARYCRPPAGPDAQCRRLRDYQRGLLLSAVFNALECLLGLLSLLLARTDRAARGRRRGARGPARARGARRARRARGARGARPGEAPLLPPEEPDAAAVPGACAGLAPRRAVAFIRVGGGRARGEAGAEGRRGGHPSVELPGYAPSDPDLDAPYPYCGRAPRDAPRAWGPGPAC